MNIETGTVSLKTLVMAIGVAVGAGIAWQAVLANVEQGRKEDAAIKRSLASNAAKVDKLAMVICLQNDASVLRCRQYGLMQ